MGRDYSLELKSPFSHLTSDNFDYGSLSFFFLFLNCRALFKDSAWESLDLSHLFLPAFSNVSKWNMSLFLKKFVMSFVTVFFRVTSFSQNLATHPISHKFCWSKNNEHLHFLPLSQKKKNSYLTLYCSSFWKCFSSPLISLFLPHHWCHLQAHASAHRQYHLQY